MLKRARNTGFTMIELLVVIAVIGILAVALLATLNPLEQIRKGRDTRTRSDMAQLTSAIERYNASLGYFPWQTGEDDNLVAATPDVPFLQIGGTGGADSITGCAIPGGSTPCTVDEALDELTSTAEVKGNFIDRITDVSYEITYLYFDDDTTGSSVIACFTPQSNTFAREAFDRCVAGNTSWPGDFLTASNGTNYVYGATGPCPDGDVTSYSTATFNASDADEMICLP